MAYTQAPSRVRELQNLLHNESKISGFYIQKPENIFWLTGFSGSFARVLIGPKSAVLVSDSRYSCTASQYAKQSGLEYQEIISGEKGKNFWKNLEKQVGIPKGKYIGFESHVLSYDGHQLLQKSFDSPLCPANKLVEKQREIKTATEISHIQKAAEIADSALQKVVESFLLGVSEKHLAWVFEESARKEGNAQSLSFDTIVAFGQNSAIPHHTPTSQKLEKNTPILIDCGVTYNGYCSDMTRCFWFGDQKGLAFEEWKNVYQQVKKAQEIGIEQILPGNAIANAEKKARKFLKKDEVFFTHSFGHGVGLEIHEAPTLHQQVPLDKKFKKNMIVTAEPGIYLPQKFGIRIEDLLVVQDTSAQKLSLFPYFI